MALSRFLSVTFGLLNAKHVNKLNPAGIAERTKKRKRKYLRARLKIFEFDFTDYVKNFYKSENQIYKSK